MKFEQLLEKNSPLLKSIEKRGFEEPTEIQEKSIPSILEGKDVIAGASTGSGKTLAFASGLIKNVEKDRGIQGLVLTPTRELAEQITNELIDFSKQKNLNVISIYGGVSIYNQVKMIPSAEIVVATPGRILDHLKRSSINFSKVNTLVLDEADRMFDMGFVDDVEKIINQCSKKRQTLLFSATISQDVARLSKKYMDNPVEISAKPHVDPKKLEQVYYDVEDGLKYSLLKHLLESEESKLIMIFCNTRKNVDFVSKNLSFMGLDVVPIHGGFSQDKRNRFLQMFNSEKSKVKILVATDVAARGLDIKGISHIYNYDIPLSVNEYTHRIGRTARAGKAGKVINLLSSRGYDNFQDIIQSKEFSIKEEKTPYIERIRIRWMPERRQERDRRRGSMRHERQSDDFKRKDDRGSLGYNKDKRYEGDSRKRSDGKQSYGGRDDRKSSGDRSRSNYSRDNRSKGRDSGRSYGGRDNRSSGYGDSRGRSDRGSSGYNRDNKRYGDRSRSSGNRDFRRDDRRSDRKNDRRR